MPHATPRAAGQSSVSGPPRSPRVPSRSARARPGAQRSPATDARSNSSCPRCSITVSVKTLRCRSVDQLVEERAVMRPLPSTSERREAPRVRLLLSMRSGSESTVARLGVKLQRARRRRSSFCCPGAPRAGTTRLPMQNARLRPVTPALQSANGMIAPYSRPLASGRTRKSGAGGAGARLHANAQATPDGETRGPEARRRPHLIAGSAWREGAHATRSQRTAGVG
jgi:hypothetical protein